MNMLRVEGLNVFYGEMQALWDVSFKVNGGEIVTIIGPNGAGKTTTLRTISGIIRPKTGAIYFLDKRIDKLPTHKIVAMGISHVPEGRHIFPYMTVLENLELGACTKEAYERRRDSLEYVFSLFPVLKDRARQLAGTLSGGEQQMLAIGRALMSRPKLLMLDEPSLGLSPKIALTVFDMIEKINDEGTTILLVEQNVHHALEIADRGYVLETGRVVLEGSSSELLNNKHIKRAYLGI